jgi:Domain of unknown function (DUF4136)
VSQTAAQDVTSNFDQGTDFSKFNTYKWVSIKNAEQVDDITARQLTAAIDAEVAKKGLMKTDSDNADLYTVTRPRSVRRNSGMLTTPGGVMGHVGEEGGMATATSSTMYVEALDLDMHEPADKRLVWRGVVSKTIDATAKPDKRQKNIQKAKELSAQKK